MNINIRYIGIGVIAMTIVHVVATRIGLYDGKVWIDMPLHVAGGVLLGLLGIYIMKGMRLVIQPAWVGGAVPVAFALGGSFLWEVLEFFSGN